jgi:hypothetical protein
MGLKNEAVMCFCQHVINKAEHDSNKRASGFVNKVIRMHVSKRRRISLADERKLDSR